jgi:plasmid stability protein
MTITITLPDELTTQLQSRAQAQHLPLEVVVINILTSALETEAEPDDYPSLEEVVAQIKATPPNPANIHPATESLADLLMNAPEDPDFDLEAWTREWAKVEAEMKAITRANDLAEGRGWPE